MSALDRQSQIVRNTASRSNLKIVVEKVQELADEFDDAHIFFLICSCRDSFSLIFEPGKDTQWEPYALETLQRHAKLKHSTPSV